MLALFFVPSKPPLFPIEKFPFLSLSLSHDLMDRKEIIPFNLNKIPPKEDALAIVLVPKTLPLAVFPPKPLTTVPPSRRYEQAYFTQACHPPLPLLHEQLLLEDAPKSSKIIIPQDTKLLPPKP